MTLNAGEHQTEDPRIDLRDHGVQPVVARPRAGLPTPLLLAFALVLAVALFLFLDARRRAASRAEHGPAAAVTLPTPPPPLALPPPPAEPKPPAAPGPVAVAPPTLARLVYPPAPTYRLPTPAPLGQDRAYVPAPRNRAALDGTAHGGQDPAMVIDLTVGGGAQVNGGAGLATGADGETAARATLIRNRAMVIPQGAIIAAVLETPLNSDQPGLARAVVSRDAHAFDGERVLIPRGSRLIGEFKADNSPGLHRVLVIWNRLIRPDGVAISIGSPATGPLGQAGVGGRVNTHFFERFSSALLQSALTVGVDLAGSRAAGGNNTTYVVLPAQAAVLGQQLVPNLNRPPTVKVREGAEIAVLVARDLDFSGTPPVK